MCISLHPRFCRRCFAVLLALILLSGCSAGGHLFVMHNLAEEEVWPQPPEPPRYRYIGELHGESVDVVAERRSWWAILVGLIQGKPEPLMLKRPYAVHSDGNGRVYVADMGLPGIMVFDLNSGELETWRELGRDLAFRAPVAISGGENGEIWVSDTELARVFRFSPSGELLGAIGQGVLTRPIGIAYHATNAELWVVDSAEHRIKIFDREGRLLRSLGQRGEEEGLFNYPSTIALDEERVYVSDTINARIQVLDHQGKLLHSLGHRGLNIGNTPRPKGVALDSDGNIYIIESYYGYLLIYDQDGRFLLPLSGKGRQIGEFYLPAGVSVDRQDRIYIADMFNGRVVILQYLGGD